MIDATCPLVTKVHNEARRFHARGDTIVLIGHDGHEEVEGTMGEAPITVPGSGGGTLVPGVFACPWSITAGSHRSTGTLGARLRGLDAAGITTSVLKRLALSGR